MAAPPRLQFFPRSPAPSPNGNGKHSVSATEAKGVTVRGVGAASIGDFIPIDGRGHTVDVRVSTERAMIASVLCYAAITYRRDKLSEPPLMVVDETATGAPWVENHPLAPLLERPNLDQEMADVIEETHTYLDLDGMALWVKQADRFGRVASVRAFSGAEFSVHPTEDRIYGEFRVQTAKGRKIYQPEEVVFFRYPHPTDRWAGLSPTDVVLSRLGIEQTLVESIKAGLRNSIVPGMVLTWKSETPPTVDQVKEYRALIEGAYAGALSHGKPFVAGGFSAEQMKLGFAGLEGGGLYRETEATVGLAFRVRPEILGMLVGLENSPWSHMDTAQRLSYDEAIIPLWRRWERTLTRQLLRPMDPDNTHFIRFDTSRVRALQADQKVNAGISVMVRGIATRNQRRQIAGLEPMEGDREFWDGVEVAAPRVQADAPLADASAKTRPASETKASDALRWAVHEALTSGMEFAWTQAAGVQLDADLAAVDQIARATLRPAAKDDDIAGAPDPSTVREFLRRVAEHFDLHAAAEWLGRVRPLADSTARKAAQRVAAELGINFDLLQPHLVDFVERESAWLVTQVTDTTKAAIRSALAEALVEGESIPAITKRIRDAGAFGRPRAELIARTEVTRATNGGQRETLSGWAAGAGETVRKRWLTAGDSRVRPAHRAMNGETHGIDEDFSNGLQHPSEPDCRCTLVYELQEAA